MNDKTPHTLLFHNIPLKILLFLSFSPDKSFTAKEIQSETNTSKGAVNQILNILNDLNIILREKKGNLFLYTLNKYNPLLKHFKIFSILLELSPLIEKIKTLTYQIILFGSASEGTNTIESDVDLFIKTDEKEKVRKLIRKHEPVDIKLQAVINDPLEIAASSKEDKVFYDQVKKGIFLWEGKPTDGI